MTVRALAAALEKTPGYISRIETTDEVPSPELICQIARVLDVEPEALLRFARGQTIRQIEADLAERHNNALQLFRRSR